MGSLLETKTERMSNMKKLAALFLALALCMGLAVPALAANGKYETLKINTMVDSTITFEAAYKEIATLKLNYGDGPEEQQVQLIVVKPGSKVTVTNLGGAESFYSIYAYFYDETDGFYGDTGASVDLVSGTVEEAFSQGDGRHKTALLMMPEYGYFIKMGDGTTAPTTPTKPTTPTFTDVKADAYYAGPVKWAVDNGVTAGTTATTFSPSATCTNAQVLTFMWRAAGSPEPAIASPFANLSGSEYYAKAAVWAYEKGMVTGTSFDSGKACTRAMTMEYFWKQAGSPETAVSDKFADVSAGSSYAQAVAWAVENGVTAGTSETTFSPDNTCTRAQIVTFLYRALV